jgi:hypothetical protein
MTLTVLIYTDKIGDYLLNLRYLRSFSPSVLSFFYFSTGQ